MRSISHDELVRTLHQIIKRFRRKRPLHDLATDDFAMAEWSTGIRGLKRIDDLTIDPNNAIVEFRDRGAERYRATFVRTNDEWRMKALMFECPLCFGSGRNPGPDDVCMLCEGAGWEG